jgi:hypothetical protein
MIYPKYSTYNVYSNAEGLTDKEFITNVYIDEIATLVRDEPFKIVKILRASKVPVSTNPTRRELINKLIDNVYVNKTLREELAMLIAAEQIANIPKSAYKRKNRGTDSSISKSANFMDNPPDLSGGINIGAQLGDTAGNVAGGVSGGAQAGGPVGAIIGAVVGVTESVFNWKTAKTNAETEANKYKLAIFEKVSEGGKRNYTPLIVIGGVLLIGTVVLIFALKK